MIDGLSFEPEEAFCNRKQAYIEKHSSYVFYNANIIYTCNYRYFTAGCFFEMYPAVNFSIFLYC